MDAEGAAMAGEDLPSGYGRTRVVGMVRDPFTCHFYWEVAEGERRDLWDRIGWDWSAGTLVVRLTEPTSLAAGPRDVVAHDWIGSLYASVEPARMYDACLGFRLADGSFFEVARGGRIETPPVEADGEPPSFYERRAGSWVETAPPWPVPDAPEGARAAATTPGSARTYRRLPAASDGSGARS